MPRGRPKGSAKKRVPIKAKQKKIEVLPNDPDTEVEDSGLDGPQIVEVKHKTEWSEYRPVDDQPEGEGEEEEQEEPKRKYTNNAEILRNKLGKAGVLPGSQLKLTIEKYHHSDAIDGHGGHYAEREHCTKYICAEEHILSEDYLDVARRFGPGLYRMTIRRKNTIVTAWDKRISGSPAPLLEMANPADPNSPKVLLPGE